MKKQFLTLLLVVCFLPIYAQEKPAYKGDMTPKGNISGVVREHKTGHAIEYANVVVYKTKDSTMLTGILTNNKGKFFIDKIPFGNYYVKVNFIGFGNKIISNVLVKPDNYNINLGEIFLETAVTNLNAVEITAQKEQVEYNLDKKVINVDKNILASGGTALDVMQTIPSVNVDIEGNVSLRGSSNVTIFIDGRPSGLTSLDQMPASMIDKIEIVTNPSARYDPDGMSGIINIVTKRKKDPGYYGMISLNAATGDKYTGSLNLGYNVRKFNIYTNIDARQFGMRTFNDIYRELYNSDTITAFYKQNSKARRKGYFCNIKLGADYFIDEKNTLSIYGVYNIRRFLPNEFTDYYTYDYQNVLSNFYNRKSETQGFNKGYEISLDYKRTFNRKNQELTANLFYSNTGWDSQNDVETDYYNTDLTPSTIPPFIQQINTVNTNVQFTGQIDYVQPLDKWGRIETGYKGAYRNSEQDYKMFNKNNVTDAWVYNTSTSNVFAYEEQLHSAYFIYANGVKNFKFQAGLRAEQVLSVSEQITMDSTYKNNYFSLFPTVHLKYEFSENHAIQISYSRRVNRPRSNNLNPFINSSDPMNLSVGNPYLKPEYTNSWELGHYINFKSTSLNTTVFYRETQNMFTRILYVLDSGVTLSTFENLDKGSSFGLEFILNQGIFKWWKINSNLSVFGLKYYGKSNISGFNDIHPSWTFKLNSMMTFWKNFDVQLGFNYNSATVIAQGRGDYRGGTASAEAQGKQDEVYFFDIGLKKDFLKNALSVSVRLSDVFKTRTSRVKTDAANYFSDVRRWSDSRVLYLGVSYKIKGGFKQKKRKQQEDYQPDFEE